MRALVCGSYDTLGDVLAALESADGTLPGSVGRVDNAFDALEVLDGKETVIVFLEVSGASDPGLGQIRALVSRGARVIVLAHEVAAEVRVAAIKAGAREVLFAPWTPKRVTARLSSSNQATSSLDIGVPTDLRAILLPDGTNEQIGVRVTNLSGLGFIADVSSSVRRDQVVRAAIQVPPPDRLPVLFARAASDASGGTCAFRFVGLAQDEEETVDALVQRLAAPGPSSKRAPPPVVVSPFESPADDDPTMRAPTRVAKAAGSGQDGRATRQTLTRVIEELDAEVLRNAPPRWLGLTLPALTDAERVSLVGGGRLAEVAVWRTRAHVIASILESASDLSGGDLPWDEWRDRLAVARESMRGELTARVADGDLEALREARDVQSRLNAVSDRIDRLAKKAGLDIVREELPGRDLPGRDMPPRRVEKDAIVTFERGALPLPPEAREAPKPEKAAGAVPVPVAAPGGGRGRLRLVFLSGAFVALLAAVAFAWTSGSQRPLPERTAIAHRAVAEVRGIRVRSTFVERNTFVVVVDGSWYERGLHEDPGGSAEMARAFAGKFRPAYRLEVRDIAGWRLAELEYADDVTPDGSTAEPPGARPPEPIPPGREPAPAPASLSR